MFSARRGIQFFAIVLLAALSAGSASGQWLVYEMKFTAQEDSVNFSFYSGAYVIASAQGGAASMILTTEEGGKFYAVAESGGKFFVAANKRVKKAAFSAVALRGSAQAFYSATGFLNRSLLLDSPSGARSWRVAELLNGRLMSTDDEGGLGPAADGSFGVIGNAIIEGILREDLTANATRSYTTMTGATTYVIELLERYGYVPDVGEVVVLSGNLETTEAPASVIDPSLFPVSIQGLIGDQ